MSQLRPTDVSLPSAGVILEMKMKRITTLALAACAAAALVAACGDDNELSSSPLAPTSIETALPAPAAGSPSRDSGTALHIDGPLPPGITRQALEQALAARNANADNVGSMTRNAARSISRPGRVTVTRADYEWRQVQTTQRAYIQLAWMVGSTPSGPFRVEVDQLGGNLVHREEPAAGSRNTEFRWLNRKSAFISPNWYVILGRGAELQQRRPVPYRA